MELKITNELKHFHTAPEVNSTSAEKDAKLKKAAKEFESLFTAMLLKSMTQGTKGLFGDDSFGGDYFQSIFENEIASKVSEGKGIGISDLIYKKLADSNTAPVENKESKETAKPAVGNSEKIDLRNHDPYFFSVPPSKTSLKRLSKYESLINEASQIYGVDTNLVKSVILAESAANEKAVSKENAKGLMQLMDKTAEEMGVNNPLNPKENILGGTKYLAQMLRLYNGDVNLALASYNAGPGNVEKYNGVPPFEETKNYIARVIGYFNHLNG
jgi:Rod binding domain-containing protein